MAANLSNEELVVKEEKKITLVFVHYFGGSALSWQWVVGILEEWYHCVSINLPGFGDTAPLESLSIEFFADHVQSQIEALNIKDYILIGHSMGGKIAMQIAFDDLSNKHIQQLILLAPSPPTIERMLENNKKRMLHHPSTDEAILTVNSNSIMPLSAERFALAVSTQNIVDDATWKWWITEGTDHSIAHLVADLTIPITVIASKDDPAVTYKMTLEDTMPNLPKHAKLVNTKGIGHLYPLESPKWVAATIHSILE